MLMLQTFDLSYFHGKFFFGDEGFQNACLSTNI